MRNTCTMQQNIKTLGIKNDILKNNNKQQRTKKIKRNTSKNNNISQLFVSILFFLSNYGFYFYGKIKKGFHAKKKSGFKVKKNIFWNTTGLISLLIIMVSAVII